MDQVDNSKVADRELLVRIDERQQAMLQSVNRIEFAMAAKVENNQDYKEMVNKVTAMWDLKNKAMGYVAAWSAFIAIAAAVLVEYVRGFFIK